MTTATIGRMSATEAREAVDSMLWAGRITPAARTYLKIRISRIVTERNPEPRLYRLVESYR